MSLAEEWRQALVQIHRMWRLVSHSHDEESVNLRRLVTRTTRNDALRPGIGAAKWRPVLPTSICSREYDSFQWTSLSRAFI